MWQRYQAQLDALYNLQPNFDWEQSHEHTKEQGWNIDDYEAELPAEVPGPPVAGGPWEIAKTIIRDYKFPPPEIITGIYYPDRPLAERVILLQARFLFFTFYFGVRVGAVVDEQRETDKGPAQVWGFNYQTLQGHFEKGQMNFEVWKWLDTGEVGFLIHAFSRSDRISNPFYWVGFKLFGRRLQRRFATRAMERMQQFVKEELEAKAHHEPAPETESPPIQPASQEKETAEQMEEVAQQATEPVTKS